jgi:hypothetical protein
MSAGSQERCRNGFSLQGLYFLTVHHECDFVSLLSFPQNGVILDTHHYVPSDTADFSGLFVIFRGAGQHPQGKNSRRRARRGGLYFVDRSMGLPCQNAGHQSSTRLALTQSHSCPSQTFNLVHPGGTPSNDTFDICGCHLFTAANDKLIFFHLFPCCTVISFQSTAFASPISSMEIGE